MDGTLDLADVRLGTAKLGGHPFLGLAFPLPPFRKLQHIVSRSETKHYWNSLYLVNGHKQVDGAEYKQMAYVLAMHPDNRLRELRKAAGLNQSQLAQRTGVSQPFISQVENQAASTLDIARMRIFAREFGCSPADLLANSDNPHRLSAEEQSLVDLFRSANSVQQAMALRVLAPLDGEKETREAA
ncbi:MULTISPECIES: helix-turn-helix domain-containing protein [unclassified Sphingomonas]|uniref:helix-turn-helix domain-containing protein n=1 Tax=unclassified Sphingomonas TaxID=196159 RepID=UPI001F21DDD6|nr:MULTISPECIES: helix-turn-helix transcriptional regulator [unclassified Sphingomonas]